MAEKLILIVDEVEDIQNHFEQVKRKDISSIRIPHGERALKFLNRQNIALLIIAQCLPDMAGFDLLRKVKKQFPALPVIFIAVSPTLDLIIDSFREGIIDFFKRPIEWNKFDERITKIFYLEKEVEDESGDKAGTFSIERLKNLNQRKRENDTVEKKLLNTPNLSFPFINNLVLNFSWLQRIFKVKNNKKIEQNMQMEHHIKEVKTQNEKKVVEKLTVSDHCTPGASFIKKKKIIVRGGKEKTVRKLRVIYFGKFQVTLDGKPLTHWPSRKVKTLFAYLILNHKKHIYKDVLMDKFWPHSDPDSARNCLNVALYNLRQNLQKIDSTLNIILYKDECYFINQTIDLYIDVEDFLAYWRLAQNSERRKDIYASLGYYELAAAIYKGDFMEEDLYQNWQDTERESLKEIYLVILDKISNFYSLDGKPSIAINLCNQILDKDNCREDVHQRLMRCYYKIGKRDKAIKQFKKCQEILKQELDVEPMSSTVNLYHQIKQGMLKG